MEIISSKNNEEKRAASLQKEYESSQSENSGEKLSKTDARRYVIALFSKMVGMFGPGMMRESDLVPNNPNGGDSDMLKTWINETQHLTSDQFANGVATMRTRLMRAESAGTPYWPPTAIKFVALASLGDQSERKAELDDYWEKNQRRIIGSFDHQRATYDDLDRYKRRWLAKQESNGYPALEDKS